MTKPKKKCGHYFVYNLRSRQERIEMSCYDCGAVYEGRIKWRKKR